MYDLVIKNGTITDGTGSPGYIGDIAVAGGKIARIGKSIDGKRIIDAKGLIVSPGFIDSHSHVDDAIFEYPDMTEKIEQGITTSVGGLCGYSLAPAAGEGMASVNGFGGSRDIYRSFGEMVKDAQNIPTGANMISFVGHASIRKAVMGFENRKPTENEMSQMKALLCDAMENGALGISFGLVYTPSCYAGIDELIELAKVVKSYNGLISAHIRNESFTLVEAVEEFLKVVKAAGVKAVLSHHKAMYKSNWGKVRKTLKMVDEAVNEGYDVYCDVYPYTASNTTLVSTVIPAEMRALDNSGIVKLVSDGAMRRKIKEKYSAVYGTDLSYIQISHCPGHPEYEGLMLDDIAKRLGQDPFDTVFDIIRDSKDDVYICKFVMCEDDVETVIKHERAMIGTDSSVAKNEPVYHPRLRGTFPRAFRRYVRERKAVSVPEMVRKCTSLPAYVYGLSSKGLLKEGYDADICIFDAERITDKADYSDCRQRCEGLLFVILGGEIAARNAVYTGSKKGGFIKANHKNT